MTQRQGLLNRLEQEQQEHQRLRPYAVFADASRGRAHPEPEHDYRTCFQRDRDRIVHSSAFRRLEAKTQVFLGADSDYYRTRLTHTVEVAQIARTMARILGLNEDLAEAVCLGHDLGHPPYGHCGEQVLNECLADHGGFEHNRQSLRVVEYLEHPYPDFRGLNLTYETRQSLAKHRSRYDHPDPSEPYGQDWPPLEGQVADLADTIAYNSHDLDDALAAELIGERDLPEIALYRRRQELFQSRWPGLKRQVRQLRCAKGLIDVLVLDALDETARRLERFAPQNAERIGLLEDRCVGLSPTTERDLDQLERFLLERVYHHPRLRQAHQRAREQLLFLFDLFVGDPKQLPQRYRRRVDAQGVERVVGDYLAGMTDRFCRGEYERLGGR